MNQVLSNVLSRLKGVKPCGNGYKAHCPAHDDQRQSLHVSEGEDGRVLIHCHAGCSVNDICRVLGIELKDLFPQKPKVYAGGKSPVVATYDYRDTNGKLLFQVCRTADKRFFQRRPDGKGGWVNGLGKVKPILYRLPEVLQAVERGEMVFIPEGEKDVNNLVQLGLAATTSPMGAGKWRDYYSEHLKGAKAVILPDNDEPGRKHAQQVAQSLYGKAVSVRVLELPELAEKGDVSDWLTAGGTKDELLRLAAECPEWRPGPKVIPSIINLTGERMGFKRRLNHLHPASPAVSRIFS
jgi:putative DNA primase/helicase